jgi:hypothetical protein
VGRQSVQVPAILADGHHVKHSAPLNSLASPGLSLDFNLHLRWLTVAWSPRRLRPWDSNEASSHDHLIGHLIRGRTLGNGELSFPIGGGQVSVNSCGETSGSLSEPAAVFRLTKPASRPEGARNTGRNCLGTSIWGWRDRRLVGKPPRRPSSGWPNPPLAGAPKPSFQKSYPPHKLALAVRDCLDRVN